MKLAIAMIAIGMVLACVGLWRLAAELRNPLQRQRETMRDPNRVVVISDSEKHYDVPAAVSAFFACSDINTILDGDRILYQNEPHTGFVIVDGQRFDCRAIQERSTTIKLGTIEPGESKEVSVLVR